MSIDRPPLGACPFCESTVTTHDVIIEYEKDGTESAFAECPACHEVVDPN